MFRLDSLQFRGVGEGFWRMWRRKPFPESNWYTNLVHVVLCVCISGNIILNLSTQKCVRDRIANEHLPEVLSLLSGTVPFTRKYLVLCMLFNLALDDGKYSFMLCFTATSSFSFEIVLFCSRAV